MVLEHTTWGQVGKSADQEGGHHTREKRLLQKT